MHDSRAAETRYMEEQIRDARQARRGGDIAEAERILDHAIAETTNDNDRRALRYQRRHLR